MQGQIISLYLDHPKVGCGWRRYLVLQQGRIHARIICMENAEALKIPATTLATGKIEPFQRTRAVKRLRATARTYGREDSWAVKLACRLLRHG